MSDRLPDRWTSATCRSSMALRSSRTSPEGPRARALMLELIELPMTAMRSRASRTRDWTVSLSPSRTEVALSADTGEGATPYLHQKCRVCHIHHATVTKI